VTTTPLASTASFGKWCGATVLTYVMSSLPLQAFVQAVKWVLSPSGVLLLAHQIRRSVGAMHVSQSSLLWHCWQKKVCASSSTYLWVCLQIVLDEVTRVPKLEPHDEPFQLFKAHVKMEGLAMRELGASDSHNADDGPHILLAVSIDHDALEHLPILGTPPLR
jgi:hypothetical protein